MDDKITKKGNTSTIREEGESHPKQWKRKERKESEGSIERGGKD